MSDRYTKEYPRVLRAISERRWEDCIRELQEMLSDPTFPAEYRSLLLTDLARAYYRTNRSDLGQRIMWELAEQEYQDELEDWVIDLAEYSATRLDDLRLARDLVARVHGAEADWPRRTLPLRALLAWPENEAAALEMTETVFRNTRGISGVIEKLIYMVAARESGHDNLIAAMLNRLEAEREDHREWIAYLRKTLKL